MGRKGLCTQAVISSTSDPSEDKLNDVGSTLIIWLYATAWDVGEAFGHEFTGDCASSLGAPSQLQLKVTPFHLCCSTRERLWARRCL